MLTFRISINPMTASTCFIAFVICKLSEQWVEAEDFDGIDADIHLYKVREKADDPLLQKLIGAYDADYPIAQREEAGTNAPTEV